MINLCTGITGDELVSSGRFLIEVVDVGREPAQRYFSPCIDGAIC